MKITDLTSYVDKRKEEGLTKIDVSLATDTEIVSGEFYVVKTKETYVLYDEDDVDKLIDEKRTLSGFIGVDKKFKAGKTTKNGETPDTWTIVVKLGF